MSKTKFLLINPPRIHRPSFNDFVVNIPIGLLSIAAYLQKSPSLLVSIIDCLVESFEIHQNNGYIRYGMSFAELKRRVSATDPDIIGIAFPFSTQSDICIKTAENLKNILPHVLVIAGGPHATVAAKKILNGSSAVDICVIGEGELTLSELLDHYRIENHSFTSLNDINGIAYKDINGNVLHTKSRKYISELDNLPYPAYYLVDMEQYLQNKFSYGRRTPYVNAKRVNMITSRGCPFDCIFCSIHLSMGRKWRAHSAEYVANHIESLISQHDIEYIHFEDDNFTCDLKRFDKILDIFHEKKIKIGWDNQNGMRADNWTFDRLTNAKKSGCSMINISIESGVQEVLDKIIKKNLKLTDVMETIKLCREVGLPVVAFFVIGIPGETVDEMKKTLLFAIKLHKYYNVDSAIMVATPFYGTRLYELCKEKGYISEANISRKLVNTTLNMPLSIIRTPSFGPEDIKSLSKWYFEQIDMIRRSE